MASRIESGSGQTMKQGPKARVWLLAALGVVVVAALTAGIIRWQASDDATTAEPAVAPVTAAADVAPPKVVEPEQPVVYIVATQEMADLQMRALAEADDIRNSMGQPPLAYSVYVAATPEIAADYIRVTDEANQVRAVEGLPLYRVVDLRP